jgi:hypothetical protein
MRTIFRVTLLLFIASGFNLVRAGDVCCDGDRWLNWSHSERDVFMEGYVRGQMHGYTYGCDSAFEAMHSRNLKNADEIVRVCLESNPSAGVDFTSYADQITGFYSKYPEKRSTPLPKLIDQFVVNSRNDGARLKQ